MRAKLNKQHVPIRRTSTTQRNTPTARAYAGLLFITMLRLTHAETVEADGGPPEFFSGRFLRASTSHAGCLSGVLCNNAGDGRILKTDFVGRAWYFGGQKCGCRSASTVVRKVS